MYKVQFDTHIKAGSFISIPFVPSFKVAEVSVPVPISANGLEADVTIKKAGVLVKVVIDGSYHHDPFPPIHFPEISFSVKADGTPSKVKVNLGFATIEGTATVKVVKA